MRNLLLAFLILLTGSATINAQTVCTPNQLYLIAGIPGVYPNPLIQSALTSGDQNVPYTETFTIMVPQDTTLDLSALIGFPFPAIQVSVNYQAVTAMTGLPTGLNYDCDVLNCQWVGGQNGCLKISGTPTQGGTFNVGMTTAYNVTVPQNVPVIGGQSVNVPIPGLSWTMDITSVGIADQQANGLWIAQTSPNPVHGATSIRYHAPKPCVIDFSVTDLTGKVMHTEQVRATNGDNTLVFDAAELASGIYLYRLSSGDKSVTSKMIVNN